MDEVLSDWYGPERAAREMVPHLPNATPISETLDKFVSNVISPGDKKLMDVKSNWKTLVGEQIAGISHPVKMYGKVICVEVAHNAWLRELNGPSKKMIIDNVNHFCGENFCEDIRFVPHGSGR